MLLKLRKNKKGFTLIELIVVVAIIAILAAIAVPNYLGMQTKAQRGVTVANASAIAGAINTYNASLPTTGTPIAVVTSAAKDTLIGASMWPTMDGGNQTTGSLSATETKAMTRVSYTTNGVAVVNSDTTSGS